VTYNNLKQLASFLDIEGRITIIQDDAMNMDKYNLPKVDLVLTSPPYFDLEIYCNENSQSTSTHSSYREWIDYFLKDIIVKSNILLTENGVSCWNVGKNDMNDDVLQYQTELRFDKVNTFSVNSSKRQSNQTLSSKKNSDITVIYQKTVNISATT